MEHLKNKLAESQAMSVMPSNKTVASGRGCLAGIAQQPDNHVFACLIPICDFKRQQIDSIVVDGWILDSFQMGDATCHSQSCFGPGLGEIRNIK